MLNVKQTAYLKVDGDFPVDGGRTAANTGPGCILLRGRWGRGAKVLKGVGEGDDAAVWEEKAKDGTV